MNIKIDFESNIPAYLQLYEQFRNEITEGAYSYGSRFPSKRVIAAETGVSVITVEHTLTLLCDEGYIESRERSGCFVIYRESDFSNAKTGNAVTEHLPATDILKSASVEFPYSVLAKTMRKVLLDRGEDILGRSPNYGLSELRNEISDYLLRSRGLSVNPGQIIIGAGAEYLYSLIAQLLGRDNIFALEAPSYEKIRKVYEAYGINCEMLPITKSGISTDSLKGSCATVLHVTPFNSYPSGITVGVSKKKEYINWAAERKGFIIEDNYDSELTVSSKAEDSLFSLSKQDNVVYINTFSRTIAPSVRTGYMLLPESLLQEFENRLGFYACTVPVFEQYVLAELLRSGDFERHVNRVRRKRRKDLKS